jgi:nucleotide-binding universal stress UspA family protein
VAFKELLLQLSSYPEATSISGIEQALEFAEVLGARISALTFEVDFYIPSKTLANAIGGIPAMIAEDRAKSRDNVRDLINAFEIEATKRALVHRHMLERALIAQIPVIVTEYSRLHDLTLFPCDELPGMQRNIAESVIFGSGRPVLVFPATRRRTPPVRLDVIGVAWDFSRPAARAVADAISLLQRAKNVRVVTVVNEKTIETRRSGPELARHLAAHGVEVILDEEYAGGRSIANVLEEYSAAYNLDILVMGAFGHSRVRDFILGEATKSMLADPPLPVFLSH